MQELDLYAVGQILACGHHKFAAARCEVQAWHLWLPCIQFNSIEYHDLKI